MADYPELGAVHEKTVFHPEGTVWTHPSGAVYRVIKLADGTFNWKLIQMPDGRDVP